MTPDRRLGVRCNARCSAADAKKERKPENRKQQQRNQTPASGARKRRRRKKSIERDEKGEKDFFFEGRSRLTNQKNEEQGLAWIDQTTKEES